MARPINKDLGGEDQDDERDGGETNPRVTQSGGDRQSDYAENQAGEDEVAEKLFVVEAAPDGERGDDSGEENLRDCFDGQSGDAD